MRLIVLMALLLIGCAREKIPHYPAMSPADSLKVIQDRSASIQNLSGEGPLILSDAGGNGVRLDAAFVLQPPDHARIRAWKFGQAVLDLTIKPDGTWLFLPRQDEHAQQLQQGVAQAGDAIRQWLNIAQGRFGDDAATDVQGRSLVVTRPMPDGLTMRCTIERRTLTPRQYELIDAAGNPRFQMNLSEYRTVRSTVWPTVIDAISSNGTIRIEIRSIEANVAPETAFTVPRRAKKLQ